jgi:organic hydroperoxide reductase OsmC/OhrA
VFIEVAAGSDADKAGKALEEAEHVCLISNSLRGERTLVAELAQTN